MKQIGRRILDLVEWLDLIQQKCLWTQWDAFFYRPVAVVLGKAGMRAWQMPFTG
jgi:hypothetical protein